MKEKNKKTKKIKRETTPDGKTIITTTHSVVTISAPSKEKIVSRAFGFEFTKLDERMYRIAVQRANKFMESEYLGDPPRMRGEYYTPGKNPQDIEDSKAWVSLDTAMNYTFMSRSEFNKFVSDYNVEKRPYQRTEAKVYYEYEFESLCKAYYLKRIGVHREVM